MEELHPSMTVQKHVQFMENQFQLTIMWLFMMPHQDFFNFCKSSDLLILMLSERRRLQFNKILIQESNLSSGHSSYIHQEIHSSCLAHSKKKRVGQKASRYFKYIYFPHSETHLSPFILILIPFIHVSMKLQKWIYEMITARE